MVLGMASCQKDVNSLEVNVGEQEAVVTVSLPEATRANSALSGLDNGVLADHDLRFILEIYQGENCYRMESIGQETSAVFPVRLVPGHEYDLVVWADFVNKGAVELADNDLYYETSNGLDEILVKDNVAMTEARDAYYGVYTLTEDKTPASIGTITLTRPFAKVRVVTTDLSDCIEQLGLQPQEATVTYTTETYDKFDARNKNVWSLDANDNVKNVNYGTSTYGEENLFVDYILVPQGTASVVKFDLNVKDVVARSFNTDIAVEANKLTTIKGNILTNGSDIKVEIDEDFAAETIYLEGDVTLTENLVIDRPMVVRPGAKAVLNLNGHDIINNTKSETFGEGEGIIAYGELDIIGNGTVQGSTMAVWARGTAGAVVNIYGGTFLGCEEGFAKGGRSVVYASSDNVVNIYGGTVKALAADKTSYANKTEGVYAALNVADNHGMINVYGGSFYKQNPVAPGTEPAAWNAIHTNGFVAERYTAVQDGDMYNVVSKDSIAIDNVDAFKTALANGQETINLKGGVVFEGIFNINNNTTIICHNAENKAVIKGRVNVANCNPTFIGVKFDTNDDSKAAFTLTGWSGYQYEAIVGIHTTGGATFNDCSFNYQDTSAITNANGFIKVTNCDFVGNSQFAIYSRANIEITDSTVKVTVPDGYENVAGFIHLNALANGKAIVKNITGCCHNGANMGHPICFGSTNNDANGVWVGPVTFDVQGDTGFTYSFYKLGSVKISHEDHIFADGSKKFTWTY